MQSEACKALQKQGYQFFNSRSSAALKPCMWNKRSLKGEGICYKQKFYGITSHRCVQLTPTLQCNQRCLFCWRSMEHEVTAEEEIDPQEMVDRIHFYQRKALAGYNPIAETSHVDPALWKEAMDPNMVAISLSGEPTCYSRLPELIDLLNAKDYTTFLVTNGTHPEMLSQCHPYQTYVSLDAPNKEIYTKLCRPKGDYWEKVQQSLAMLGDRRSAIRITVVQGFNDVQPENYAKMIQMSGADFVEVKGYMYVGYSIKRMKRENMPEHEYVKNFAEEIAKYCDYEITDESPISRVVLMERPDEI